MDTSLLPILIGVAVIALFVLVSLVLVKTPGSVAERRLDDLSGKRKAKEKADRVADMLLRPPAINLGKAFADRIPNLEGLNRLYEQADVGFDFKQFLAIAGGLFVVGGGLGLAMGQPLPIVAVGAALLGILPFFWLVLRKRASGSRSSSRRCPTPWN